MGKYDQLKDIEVYVLARKLADRAWKEVLKWDHFAQRTVGQQLVRAVDSISANIAESYGRHHVRDVTLFLYYARGSLYESQDWISKAVQRGLFDEATGRELLDTIQLLAPKLNAYISAKRRRETPSPDHLTTANAQRSNHLTAANAQRSNNPNSLWRYKSCLNLKTSSSPSLAGLHR